MKSFLSLIYFGLVEIFLGNYCLSLENVAVCKQALEIQKAFWGALISHCCFCIWRLSGGGVRQLPLSSFCFLQVLCEGLKCSSHTVLFTLCSGQLTARNHRGYSLFSQLFQLLSESSVDSLVHIRCIFIKQRCYIF